MSDAVTPYKFSTEFHVRWVEVDIQQVVFFAHYLTYCDEALMAYLRLFDFSFPQLWAIDLDWVYADAHIQYKGSAQFEDRVRVHVRIARIGNSSVNAELQLFRLPAHDSGATPALIATAQLVFVVVARETRTPARVPDFFRAAVEAYQADA